MGAEVVDSIARSSHGQPPRRVIVEARSPFARTLVSGYTGVGWTYLPTADAYPLGGYEVEVTPFASEAADLAITGCLDVLADLRDGG